MYFLHIDSIYLQNGICTNISYSIYIIVNKTIFVHLHLSEMCLCIYTYICQCMYLQKKYN